MGRDRMLDGRNIEDNQEITKIENRPKKKKAQQHFCIICKLSRSVIAMLFCMYRGKTRFQKKEKKKKLEKKV